VIYDSDWASYVAKCDEVNCDLTQVSSTWSEYISQRKDLISSIGHVEDFLGTDRREASGTAGSKFDIAYRWSGEPIKEYLEDLLSVPIDDELVPDLPVDICLWGQQYNTAFVWNYLATVEVDRYVANSQALRTETLFELGGGFGCMAAILIGKYRPSFYYYCDLKENLRNTIAYFKHTLGTSCSIHLISCEDDIPLPTSGITRICLIAPKFIRRLDLNGRVDIAINSDSLGEMKRETAKTYIQIIAGLMADSGNFFSFNGHRRGSLVQEGFNRVSDYYPEQILNIIKISAKPYLSSALEDYGHIAICRKSTSGDETEKCYRDRWLNVLTDIYAMGISEEIQLLTSAFNSGSLNYLPFNLLLSLESALEGSNIIHREVQDIYQGISDVITYITHVQLLCGKPTKKVAEGLLLRLEATVPSFKSDVPMFIFLLLAYIYRFSVTSSIRMTPTLAFCLRELETAKNGTIVARLLYRELRLSQLRKKFFPRRKYDPSLVALIHGKISDSLVLSLMLG